MRKQEMNSPKKDLYRRVPSSDNAGAQSPNRKPLVQGQLVTNATMRDPDDPDVIVTHIAHDSDLSHRMKLCQLEDPDRATPEKYYSVGEVERRGPAAPEKHGFAAPEKQGSVAPEDPTASPRRCAPLPAALGKGEGSPLLLRRSESLELSDTESDTLGIKSQENPGQVVVVDAMLDSSRSPESTAEVGIVTEIISSPALITSHVAVEVAKPSSSKPVVKKEDTNDTKHEAGLKKKKKSKGRIVPSRYMAAAGGLSSKRNESGETSAAQSDSSRTTKTSARSVGMPRNVSRVTKPKRPVSSRMDKTGDECNKFYAIPHDTKCRGSLKAMSTPATASRGSMQVFAGIQEDDFSQTRAQHVKSISRSSYSRPRSKRESKAAPSLEDDQLTFSCSTALYHVVLHGPQMSKKACDHQEADAAETDVPTLARSGERLDDYKSRLDLALDKVKHIKMLEKPLQHRSFEVDVGRVKDKYANMAASVEATYASLKHTISHIPRRSHRTE
ncbi:PREDICTED: uncharacterized protein LOC106810538 [Priapulus caudatus]|uniref:Uncharacterized protein LOC106810538 n=1 Tax=Priapulus caudatus TaxID=37621 RepID=A0ABM1EB34_PRICU|nr:PREDICTED: uncharacterized protein LOC106810538 [Priapulus caudatus]